MAETTTTRTSFGFPAVRDVVVLLKPSITLMSVLVAGGSMLLAPHELDLQRALMSLLGIAMSVMGAGALNMYLERDVDALMARTRTRPLPAGRMDSSCAAGVGLLFSLGSLPVLLAASNLLTVWLTAFSLFVYVLVYTPMKRTTPWSLVVGSFPGAAPALMGYTAATGRIDVIGLFLFGIVFFWQLPHFIAISIYREREYVAAGHRVVSAMFGVPVAKALVALTAVPLVVVSFGLWPLGVAGPVYATVAALLGVWFFALSAKGFSAENPNSWARRVFFGSLVYQTVLFAALALDVGITRLVGGS